MDWIIVLGSAWVITVIVAVIVITYMAENTRKKDVAYAKHVMELKDQGVGYQKMQQEVQIELDKRWDKIQELKDTIKNLEKESETGRSLFERLTNWDIRYKKGSKGYFYGTLHKKGEAAACLTTTGRSENVEDLLDKFGALAKYCQVMEHDEIEVEVNHEPDN